MAMCRTSCHIRADELSMARLLVRRNLDWDVSGLPSVQRRSFAGSTSRWVWINRLIVLMVWLVLMAAAMNAANMVAIGVVSLVEIKFVHIHFSTALVCFLAA